MISHKYKCIFVHIPKAAGTSLMGALRTKKFEQVHGYVGHSKKPKKGRLDKILSSSVHDINNYFKFAFCRNPYDRIVSVWKYLSFIKPAGRLNRFPEFKNFIKLGLNVKNDHWRWHYYPQYYHICSKNRNPDIDYIGRFENLQEDFNTICDKIGIPHQQLPHKNKSKHKHYTEYYDEETKQIVAEKYAKDIEYFNYKFGE
jgi:hypothetical protein